MYVTFLRDGCSISDTDKLEKVLLYAARIATGLPFKHQKNLYNLKLVGNNYAKKCQIDKNVQNAYKHSASIPM